MLKSPQAVPAMLALEGSLPETPDARLLALVSLDLAQRETLFALVAEVCQRGSGAGQLTESQRIWCERLTRGLRPGVWLPASLSFSGEPSFAVLCLLRPILTPAAWLRLRLSFPQPVIVRCEAWLADEPVPLSGNSNRRVSMRLALEPNNTQHFDCTVNVSSRRADALYYANKAIDDTWRILDMGSGNQKNHVRATMAESYKRTLLSQKETGNGDYTVRAWEASKFRAGNCGEMAAVNALLLANSRVKQPVSVVHNRDVDHAFVIIGDPRENGRSVVSDPWPEFGRAMRIEDAKFGDSYHVLHTYPVGHRDDDVREKLLRGEKATQAEVDKAFRKAAPKLAKLSPEKLRDSVVAGPGYVQRHASNNLGIQYDGTDSRGVVQHFDQSLSVGQMRSRMIGPQAAVDAQQRGTPAPTFTSNDRPRQRTESFAAESSSRGRRPRTASNAVPPAAPRRRANSVDIRPAPMPIYAPPPPAPGGMYSTVPLPGHAPAFNYGPPPAAAPVYSYGPPPAAAPVYSYGPPPVHAHAPVHAMASRPVYREPPVIPPDVYGTAPAPARTRPRSNSVTAAFRRIIGN